MFETYVSKVNDHDTKQKLKRTNTGNKKKSWSKAKKEESRVKDKLSTDQ